MSEQQPSWDNLFSLFQSHIDEAVKKQVAEQIANLDNKEFYSLDEVEQRTGITRRALRERNQRGTIKLNRFGANTLLMSKVEFKKLLDKIHASR